MVRKQCPSRFWDHGMKWVSKIQSLTYNEAGGIKDTPLFQVTGDDPDISEYLDFAFYDEAFY